MSINNKKIIAFNSFIILIKNRLVALNYSICITACRTKKTVITDNLFGKLL